MLGRTIMANFSTLETYSVSEATQELYDDVAGAGYWIYSLVGRIGIWACLNAILLLGYYMATRNGNKKERTVLKSIITKTIIVSILLLNVGSFVGCAIGVGFDMF